MTTPSLQIAIDAGDPHLLNRFWSRLMDYEIEDHHDQILETPAPVTPRSTTTPPRSTAGGSGRRRRRAARVTVRPGPACCSRPSLSRSR